MTSLSLNETSSTSTSAQTEKIEFISHSPIILWARSVKRAPIVAGFMIAIGGLISFLTFDIAHRQLYSANIKVISNLEIYGYAPLAFNRLYALLTLIMLYNATVVYNVARLTFKSKYAAVGLVSLFEFGLIFTDCYTAIPCLLVCGAIHGLYFAYATVSGLDSMKPPKPARKRTAKRKANGEEKAQKPVRNRTRKAKAENQDIVTSLEPAYAEV